jgi:hypothetical protein
MVRVHRRVGMLALIVPVLVAALLIAGCGSSKKSPSSSSGTAGKATIGGTGQTIDGIPCNRTEQLTYHVHAHLLLLINGVSAPLPALIGIPIADGAAECFYFLHTHDTTGVIHIEAPKPTTFHLGQFFDIWGQPLSRTRASALKGPLHVFVGKKPFTGNPRNIPLTPHELITIEQGKLVKPPSYTFAPGL